MTTITICRNHGKPVGFRTQGHAGYAEHGEDIVCAGISVLVVNTINSIETFTDCHFSCEVKEESGDVRFEIKGEVTPEAELLMNSMVLGLQGIQNDYGKKFLRLLFKEV